MEITARPHLPARDRPTAYAGLAGLFLVPVAAAAWWLTVTAPMPVALPSFLFGWSVMMTAMMLPALVPVVALYGRAARRRTVAPMPVFLAGYLAVWTAMGLPAYVAWRQLQPAIMDGQAWTGRLAGGALLLAAGYQVTPWKQACLRGCRSPLTAFTALRGSLADPRIALRVGARNGLWCLGCCWALMVVLVVVGVMQPWWMVAVATVVFAEKALPWGPRLSRPLAAALAGFGVLFVVEPQLLVTFTS